MSLVRRAASGDEEAFEALVARHGPALLAVARARTRDEALAEEIAQDTFVRLFRHLSRFRGDSSLRTWLVRIALNLCTDAQRRDPRRFEGTMDLAANHRAPDVGADWIGIHAEESTRVRDALERLSPPLRLVVSLRYDGGLSYADIAAMLHVPIGTVGSRLAAALQQLRAALAA